MRVKIKLKKAETILGSRWYNFPFPLLFTQSIRTSFLSLWTQTFFEHHSNLSLSKLIPIEPHISHVIISLSTIRYKTSFVGVHKCRTLSLVPNLIPSSIYPSPNPSFERSLSLSLPRWTLIESIDWNPPSFRNQLNPNLVSISFFLFLISQSVFQCRWCTNSSLF